MDLDATKKFLLVKAIEEADRDGDLIPDDSRGLLESESSGDDAALARSGRLYASLETGHPQPIQSAMAATDSHGWIKLAVLIGALLIGLATKQLGPDKRINVLAIPLLGVLAWNLVVYLIAIGARDSGAGGDPFDGTEDGR